MAFYALERLINLYDGYIRSFRVANHSLLLVQDQGRSFIIANQCPHQQAPLDKSVLRDGCLQCPIHGMRFDLLSGKTSDGCGDQLRFFPISYEGNTIGVNL